MNNKSYPFFREIINDLAFGGFTKKEAFNLIYALTKLSLKDKYEPVYDYQNFMRVLQQISTSSDDHLYHEYFNRFSRIDFSPSIIAASDFLLRSNFFHNVPVEEVDAILMSVYPEDRFDSSRMDNDICSLLIDRTPNNDKIFHCGAGVGDYLINVLKRNRSTEIFAFEPNLENCVLLKLRSEMLASRVHLVSQNQLRDQRLPKFDQIIIQNTDWLIRNDDILDHLISKASIAHLMTVRMSFEFQKIITSYAQSLQFSAQIELPRVGFGSINSNIFEITNTKVSRVEFFIFKEKTLREVSSVQSRLTIQRVLRLDSRDVAVSSDKQKIFARYQISRNDLKELISKAGATTKLKEICNIQRGSLRGRIHPQGQLSKGRSIMINDLPLDPTDIFITKASGKLDDSINQKRSFPLESKCIVVNLMGKLRPKIYDPDNFKEPVYLNEGLIALFPKQNTSLEFIIYQLLSPFVAEQIKLLSSSVATIPRITLADAEDIRIISVQSQEEEAKYVFNQKLELVEKEHLKLEALQSKLDLKEQKQEAEFEIVRHIAHNINPKLAEVGSVLKHLKNFLYSKGLSESLLIEDSDFDTVGETTGKALESASEKISNIHRLIKETRALVVEIIPSSEYESINLANYLKKMFEKKSYKTKKAKIIFDSPVKFKSEIRIHPGSFEEMLENIIRNADMHGFKTASENNEIKFKISEDQEFIYIDCINNGNPLPSELTTEKFLSFGVKSNESSGDGLGGAFIKKVLDAHQARFEIIPDPGNYPHFRISLEKGADL